MLAGDKFRLFVREFQQIVELELIDVLLLLIFSQDRQTVVHVAKIVSYKGLKRNTDLSDLAPTNTESISVYIKTCNAF